MRNNNQVEFSPKDIKLLFKKIGDLDAKVDQLMVSRVATPDTANVWMDIKQLCDYLPTHPARQTVYEWVKDKIIPCHKTTKKLTFNKDEIDRWLQNGYRKTTSELASEAEEFVNNYAKRGNNR